MRHFEQLYDGIAEFDVDLPTNLDQFEHILGEASLDISVKSI